MAPTSESSLDGRRLPGPVVVKPMATPLARSPPSSSSTRDRRARRSRSSRGGSGAAPGGRPAVRASRPAAAGESWPTGPSLPVDRPAPASRPCRCSPTSRPRSPRQGSLAGARARSRGRPPHDDRSEQRRNIEFRLRSPRRGRAPRSARVRPRMDRGRDPPVRQVRWPGRARAASPRPNMAVS